MSLTNKIDFAVVFSVKNANPNGDPLNGNRPRTTYENLGEISDVCIKRKIRDRLQESGQVIFVQSDDRKKDEFESLHDRAVSVLDFKKKPKAIEDKACKEWFDVRAFGQLFPYKGGAGEDKGVSIGIRGPVSIHPAFSISRVDVSSNQITKSASGEKSGKARASDTMGMKHRVDSGIYVFYGSMNPQLAVRTGFSDGDAAVIKSLLPKLFENDASSARPEGSMEVLKVIWWEHKSNNKQPCPNGLISSAKVHRSLRDLLKDDANKPFDEDALKKALPGLVPEIVNGF
ncbi:MAG: type I-C CRISPR-associated protein Cas7/Csd2 [Candidatus Edwardsbacteria bacterium RIFOXYD12_FULL_50_11]|uniref:Type I-C CRISPR-associated protein Cas7/Csd2 n=1 Tax=Candidatus Edwardsbacteria bacterium GWF2_54_11 TaxID=1817851 RepID=A0A1F5RFE8_9BACT|nr:MAG: type I-C CRISPR-associated protein Cas7/Csd2 [Candidatus Edwardsbacteria bacterium RifOxyC12_full_54_24]OGF07898.1 MAG: type I-C CRISPR-associated protein Cas7/Csd2 [Candidatus Edwardsbacteria bacterium RifOxyA12_full_54_48]OGF10146.1 MAG: type I-C CRISPR-associated protein Cas7/Csd2 [Candidatus Edwardsbacteria bacterium GWE2_54_12]OGF13088.1 MAG: type I-C CRISPR-associated protein Cas7/Csd2 [Candidatus Edwardsbacteria bacterium GWF2_54_11]OGF15058.1 MAG: type I-C CRISPR-associated prot